MATYFIAAKYSPCPGTVYEGSILLTKCEMPPEDKEFLENAAAKVAAHYEWPASEIVITCISRLSP